MLSQYGRKKYFPASAMGDSKDEGKWGKILAPTHTTVKEFVWTTTLLLFRNTYTDTNSELSDWKGVVGLCKNVIPKQADVRREEIKKLHAVWDAFSLFSGKVITHFRRSHFKSSLLH